MRKSGIRVEVAVRLAEQGALEERRLEVEARRREMQARAQERLNAVLYPVGVAR